MFQINVMDITYHVQNFLYDKPFLRNVIMFNLPRKLLIKQELQFTSKL
jgi:hypothetical protein